MAQALAQPAWIDVLTDRLAESLDRTCVYGMACGLALWLPIGLGVELLAKRLERPVLATGGSLLWYLGIMVVSLVLLRWMLYMLSPRMATLLDREVGAYF